MAYQIIYKKQFTQKLFKLLDYLETEWTMEVADNFLERLQKRIQTLSQQPFIGAPSSVVKGVRSILITRHNRLFYRVKGNTLEIINIFDTRINPDKNRY